MVQKFKTNKDEDLQLTSVEEVGNEITLILPAGQLFDESGNAVEPNEQFPSQGSRILLVEDQLLLGQMTKDILEERGFNAETAKDAEDALRLLAAGELFDLVITDIKMPGMSGFDLANEVRLISPKARIIYITGYPDDPENENREIHGPILKKPVGPGALLAIIRRVLADC